MYPTFSEILCHVFGVLLRVHDYLLFVPIVFREKLIEGT